MRARPYELAMADRSDQISTFVAITDCNPERAQHLLDASGWDIDAAVQLHFDTAGAAASAPDDGDQESEALVRRMMQEDAGAAADPGLAVQGAPAPMGEYLGGAGEDAAAAGIAAEAQVGAAAPAGPVLDEDGIRIPDAARTERLFDVPGMGMGMGMPGPMAAMGMGRGMGAGMRRPRLRDGQQHAGANLSDDPSGGLDTIYQPPADLMSDMTLQECEPRCPALRHCLVHAIA